VALAAAASPSLVFGAMDCASDYVLCRSMGITGYPAIRLYGRGFGPIEELLGVLKHPHPPPDEYLN